MADDDKALESEGGSKPAATVPALDPVLLGKQISDQVSAGVAEALRNQPRVEPVVPSNHPVDALAEVIEPYVRAGSARATLIAQLAADKADFYTASDPDDLEDRLAYKEEVEKRALAMASLGRAMPREDIFKHLKGEKFTEFVEKAAKRKVKREDRARFEGGDDAAGGAPRQRGGEPAFISTDLAHDLQGKGKLDESLADKQF